VSNVTVFLNAAVTSRLILSGNRSEASLLIDDPHPLNQLVYSPTAAPVEGTGSGVNYKGGMAPNIFFGSLYNPLSLGAFNEVVFDGVPLDPPGTANTRTLRITNVRVNATALDQTPVVALVTASGSVWNGTYTFVVGNPQPSLTISTLLTAPLNVNCSPTPLSVLQPVAYLQFMPNFDDVFRVRGSPEDVPGTSNNSESGFAPPASAFSLLPSSTASQLENAGQADYGTRLGINLSGVIGAQVYFPLNVGPFAQTSTLTGPFSQPAATTGVMLEQTIGGVSTTVPVVEVQVAKDGTATVAYEYTGAPTSSNSSGATVTIPYAVTCTNPGSGFTITAHLGFGPNGYNLNAISGIPFFSAVNFGPNGNNFQTGIAVANTTTDAALTASTTEIPVTQVAGSYIPTSATAAITSNGGPALSGLTVNVTNLSVPQVAGSDVLTNARAASSGNGGRAISGPESSVDENPAITAFLSSTTTPSVVNIYVNGAGLNAGTATATIQVSDSSGGMVSIPVSAFVAGTPPVVTSVENGASFAQGAVAGQEIVSLFGTGIGPSTGATFGLISSASMNTVAPDTGGVEVFFDQYPGSVLYASQGQINVTVPTEIAGQASTNVVVINNNNGTETAAFNVPVAPASPAVFELTAPPQPQAAALNQDGTVNGTSSPAAGGNYIVLFLTGLGATNPPVQDGAVNPTSPPFPAVQGVTVMIGGQAVVPSYAGAAPGLVSGVYQINAQVPKGLTSPAPVTVTANGVTSPTVYIAVE
jgi:uncharacterized protein (TIGR03437 family)